MVLGFKGNLECLAYLKSFSNDLGKAHSLLFRCRGVSRSLGSVVGEGFREINSMKMFLVLT